MPRQTTTGVVQANAYRTTPVVVSVVVGILRRVAAELGQNVGQAQTIAVVFSDELATALSLYLNAVAELDELHRHHVRTVRLVEIANTYAMRPVKLGPEINGQSVLKI